jgi:hypothetical protein
MTSRLLLVLSALAFASCSSVAVVGEELGGPPRDRRAYPPQTLEGIVYAQARYADHVAEFGQDLVEDAAVVPIRLRVQLRGQGAGEAQILLDPSRMNLRLVLADGAALQPVPFDDFAGVLDDEAAAAVRKLAFRGGLLEEQATEGYVFFALRPPAEFAMASRVVRHGDRGIVRSFDITSSLLAFDAAIGSGGQRRPFYVGIER